MIDYLNTQMIRVIANVQALAANRRGADSLEWMAIAIVIVGAVLGLAALFGKELENAAKNVFDRI